MLQIRSRLDVADNTGAKMAKMIGWIGLSLISICATVDVNFADCLEVAYEEGEGNQDVFEDEDS